MGRPKPLNPKATPFTPVRPVKPAKKVVDDKREYEILRDSKHFLHNWPVSGKSYPRLVDYLGDRKGIDQIIKKLESPKAHKSPKAPKAPKTSKAPKATTSPKTTTSPKATTSPREQPTRVKLTQQKQKTRDSSLDSFVSALSSYGSDDSFRTARSSSQQI